MIDDQLIETPRGTVCCVSDRVTVQQAKRYAEIMRDMEQTGDSARAAVRAMTRLLADVYGGLRVQEAARAPVVQVVTAAKALHFVMQEIVFPAFSILSDEPPIEQEASVFDDYDAEEGYTDNSPANFWATCLESLEVITQASIKIMRQSYTETMKEELVPLIEHLKWEIDHQPEKKGG